MANVLQNQVFPLDPTGTLASNKITSEYHVFTEANWRSYHFIVPKKGPYFEDSLVIKYTNPANEVLPLRLGIDWVPSYWFLGASRACAKNIYGGITFLNTKLNGHVEITYQTIGGEWVLDEGAIAEILANKLNNPLTTTWEVIANVPKVFPPEPHDWNLVDMVGAKDLNDSLQEIVELLRTKSEEGITGHINDTNNPHRVTKAQVGLGSVSNLPILPANKYSDKTNNYYITPMSLNGILTNGIMTDFNNFKALRNNPHHVTAAQAGTYSKQEINNLLSNKLDTTAIAFDTQRFAGMTFQEVKANILTGTAANSNMIAGRTYSELVAAVTTEANKNDAFGGRSPEEYKAWVLEGTANNAIRFNNRTDVEYKDWLGTQDLNAAKLAGKDLAGVLAEAKKLKVNDSERLGGKTLAEITQAVQTALGSDALTLAGKTKDEVIAEALAGTAANANKVFNRDFTTLMTDILSGTASDTIKFTGKTYDEVKTDILKGTADNALTLNGKTYNQLVSEITLNASGGNTNATTLENKTLSEIMADVRASTVDSANKVGGRTVEEIIGDATAGVEDRFVGKAIYTNPTSFTDDYTGKYYVNIGVIKSVAGSNDTPLTFDIGLSTKYNNVAYSLRFTYYQDGNNRFSLKPKVDSIFTTPSTEVVTQLTNALGIVGILNTTDASTRLFLELDYTKLRTNTSQTSNKLAGTITHFREVTTPYFFSLPLVHTGFLETKLNNLAGSNLKRYTLTSEYSYVDLTTLPTNDKVVELTNQLTTLETNLGTTKAELTNTINTKIQEEVVRANNAYPSKVNYDTLNSKVTNLTTKVNTVEASIDTKINTAKSEERTVSDGKYALKSDLANAGTVQASDLTTLETRINNKIASDINAKAVAERTTSNNTYATKATVTALDTRLTKKINDDIASAKSSERTISDNKYALKTEVGTATSSANTATTTANNALAKANTNSTNITNNYNTLNNRISSVDSALKTKIASDITTNNNSERARNDGRYYLKADVDSRITQRINSNNTTFRNASNAAYAGKADLNTTNTRLTNHITKVEKEMSGELMTIINGGNINLNLNTARAVNYTTNTAASTVVIKAETLSSGFDNNSRAIQSATLILNYNNSVVINWPSTVKFSSGQAPVLEVGKTYIFTIILDVTKANATTTNINKIFINTVGIY